jgi:Holliday junction resolvase-like predicted endonuclease
MKIIKASGLQETYNKQKLCDSLQSVGAPKTLVDRVCRIVGTKITPGMNTKEISRHIASLLAKENPVLAAKYSLKRGIMELGPAGFLFEQYVAAILQEYGYTTSTNQMMKGECGIFHEIDVLAFSKDTHYIVEAKYRNNRGVKSDVKVAMYSFARLLDIAAAQKKRHQQQHKAWLFTNTKFTSSTIQYALCKSIKLTGWKYPKKESLEQLIEAKSLYPVTVLPAVNKTLKEQFAAHELYFAKDLVHIPTQQFQRLLGIQTNIANSIQQQAAALCE